MSRPTEEFDAACSGAGVSAEHREALWRLYMRAPAPAPAGSREAERIAAILADYGHWRLFEASREGDPAAARRFEAHWRDAARSFLGRGFTAEQVEEFTAVFFARVYQRVTGFAWAVPFQVYLRTVLLNIARDEIRRLRRSREREVSIAGEEDLAPARRGDPAPSAEDRLLAAERGAAVRRALDRMAPVDRAILTRFVVEGEAGEVIAAALGIGKDALYQRLSRARRRLRVLIDEEMSGR